MATTPAKAVYSHITKDPKVRDGEACIDGTRIRVADIVWMHQQGHTPDEILEQYPNLNLAKIYAALSYYHECKEEIQACFESDKDFSEQLERQWEEYVARHGGHPPEVPAPEDRHIAKPANWKPKS
jgi:uncharacterized protein (DUF433 family)